MKIVTFLAGQSLCTYLVSTLCHVTPVDFLLTPSPPLLIDVIIEYPPAMLTIGCSRAVPTLKDIEDSKTLEKLLTLGWIQPCNH